MLEYIKSVEKFNPYVELPTPRPVTEEERKQLLSQVGNFNGIWITQATKIGLIDPMEYDGVDLSNISPPALAKLMTHFEECKFWGFTNQKLGDNLGQKLLALQAVRGADTKNGKGPVRECQGSWVFDSDETKGNE